MAQPPCFLSPFADSPLLPLLVPFTYLETLLAVTGSVHLGLRLLVNWPPLSQPFPIPSPLQIPSTQVNRRLTMTTSRIRLLLSGTGRMHWCMYICMKCMCTILEGCLSRMASFYLGKQLDWVRESKGILIFEEWADYLDNKQQDGLDARK